MAVAQLASSDDVAAELGRALTSSELVRVKAILDKASEVFRREARQRFTPGESTVRLKVNGGRVGLPERPVTEVTTVVDDDGEAVEYEQQGAWLVTCLPSDRFVTVTYSHGGEVPDLVRLTVASIAAQVLRIPEEVRAGANVVSESIGAYSYNQTYAAWAVGGQTMLAPEDKKIARGFRPVIPTVWVTSV